MMQENLAICQFVVFFFLEKKKKTTTKDYFYIQSHKAKRNILTKTNKQKK